jgi:hypothetical protein
VYLGESKNILPSSGLKKKHPKAGSKLSFSKPYGITSQKTCSHCFENIRAKIPKGPSGRLFPALFAAMKIERGSTLKVITY